MDDVLTIAKPENPLPLIFDSPHSGTNYPEDFDYACDFETLERAEDKYVDQLFTLATDFGGTLLCAQFPRSYIDPNRSRDDLDPDLLGPEWEHKISPSDRALAGIGLIRRLIRPEQPVYNRLLTMDEINDRIHTYYIPYHEALGKLIEEAHNNFGQVWHINCHSMPSHNPYANSLSRINPLRHADFVLGDRDGTTCDPELTRLIRNFLKDRGYKVTINDPYRGVELVRRYSNPSAGRHSLQIEINKALYMNEETGEKHKGFQKLQADITALIRFLADHAQSQLIPLAAD